MLRPLDPSISIPRLEPAWGAPLPLEVSARTALLAAWADLPEPGALGRFADGEPVAVALAYATTCGLRIVAVHGDLEALLAGAITTFAGQRLEVQCEGEVPALARAGFAHVLDQVHYRAALGPLPALGRELRYETFADVGDRGLRRILEAVWPGTASPTGRTALEELAELRAEDTRHWRIAFADGEPVGVALARLAGRKGMLRLLAVVAHRRGEGIGRALHRDALRRLHAAGATHYVDTTGATNVPMRRLLEAAGAEPTGAGRLYALAPPPAPRVHGPDDLRRLLGGSAPLVRRPGGVVRVPVEWDAASGTVRVGGERWRLDRDGSIAGEEVRPAVWRAARRAALAPLHRIPIVSPA